MFGWLKKKKPSPPQPPRRQTIPVPSMASKTQSTSSGGDGLATSMMLGYALNDGIVGGLIGGNLAGGIIGDAMNTSESDHPKHEPTPEAAPASESSWQPADSPSHSGHDTSSSHDWGGSSYDSGSAGGGFD